MQSQYVHALAWTNDIRMFNFNTNPCWLLIVKFDMHAENNDGVDPLYYSALPQLTG